MPPKGKVASKPREAKSAPAPPLEPPKTVHERSLRAYYATNPFVEKIEKSGLSSLSSEEQIGYAHSLFAKSAEYRDRYSAKAQKEAWRYVNEHNLPVRAVKNKPTAANWGKDRSGRNIGDYTPEEFEVRREKQEKLAQLSIASHCFEDRRRLAQDGSQDIATGEPFVLTQTDIDEERERRRQLAALRKDLYGEKMGKYEQDPEWDDVVPVPVEEPEGALAAIAYPEDYAEAVSYLRAVMIKKEYSQRCLALTDHIISMNPAHYTVWVYRASIVLGLGLPILNELKWLNEVALDNLKNYQIWHHRHLLVEHHYPSIAERPEEVRALAASERQFLATILAEDTKNYHVWSYRTWLVGQLGQWGEPEELAAVEVMINDDVRNNSAWSHRFFLVFSNPDHATPDSLATQHDPKVPKEIIDREIQYAMDKTYLAPQNQSAWNYLKGVLVKGGRPLASVETFVLDFVRNLGEDDKEDLKSTHALDLLAEIYAEKGEKEKANLCLRRLADKWDQIRKGYWEWRIKCLEIE